ncbi:glutamine--scyllo-inositol aminotransferase, partial [Rhizobium ruizarguesonis]
MTNRIFYTKPSITQLETDYATDSAATGWGARCYDYLNRFERDFKTYLCSGF